MGMRKTENSRLPVCDVKDIVIGFKGPKVLKGK